MAYLFLLEKPSYLCVVKFKRTRSGVNALIVHFLSNTFMFRVEFPLVSVLMLPHRGHV